MKKNKKEVLKEEIETKVRDFYGISLNKDKEKKEKKQYFFIINTFSFLDIHFIATYNRIRL